jgi:hypothetical protein
MADFPAKSSVHLHLCYPGEKKKQNGRLSRQKFCPSPPVLPSPSPTGNTFPLNVLPSQTQIKEKK